MRTIGLIVLFVVPFLAACKHPEPQPDYGAVKAHANQSLGSMDQEMQKPAGQ